MPKISAEKLHNFANKFHWFTVGFISGSFLVITMMGYAGKL